MRTCWSVICANESRGGKRSEIGILRDSVTAWCASAGGMSALFDVLRRCAMCSKDLILDRITDPQAR